MTLHNTFSGLWHLNNTVRSFRPAEVVHESLDWQLNYSTAAWALCHGCVPQDGWTDGWMDGWMDGGGEFVLSLSIRAVRTTQCVYTLKTARQMAQAIKCTDKMETNNRWGEENCERPLGQIRQIWACDWAEHSGRLWQALFALIQPVMGRSGNVRGFNKTAADGTSGSGTLSCPLSKTKTGHIPQGQAVGHSVGYFCPVHERVWQCRGLGGPCQDFIFNHLFSDLFQFYDNTHAVL